MLEKIGRNIGVIFLGIVIIIIFLWGKSCGNSPKTDSKPHTDTLIIHKTDTIRDTVTVVKIKLKPIIIDSNKVDSSLYKDLYYQRTYENIYRDSNLVITSTDTVIGKLIAKDIKYKLLIPIKIYDSTKVIIKKDSIVYRPNKWDIKVGILAGFKTLAPTIDYTKNRTTYMVAYDPFNKMPYVGIKYTIFRSKR